MVLQSRHGIAVPRKGVSDMGVLETATDRAIVRRAGEGEKLWFFGGGVWTWKLDRADTGGGLSVVEGAMEAGEKTPLPTPPIGGGDWGLRGERRYRTHGEDTEGGGGGHAFLRAAGATGVG